MSIWTRVLFALSVIVRLAVLASAMIFIWIGAQWVFCYLDAHSDFQAKCGWETRSDMQKEAAKDASRAESKKNVDDYCQKITLASPELG